MFVGRGEEMLCLFFPSMEKRVSRERERPNCSPRPTSDTVSCVTEESFYCFSHFISQLFESHMLQPNILLAFIFYRNQYYLQYIKQSIRAWHLLSFWIKTMPAICRGITTKKGPQSLNLVSGTFFRRTRLFCFLFFFFHPSTKSNLFFF